MKTILTTNEFPKWFNLSKYEKFKNFSTRELYLELLMRREIQLNFLLNSKNEN
jgi:hypothetical protein